MRLIGWLAAVGLLGVACAASAGEAPRAFAAGSVPAPHFADPDRPRKLEAAFADVDRAFREYQQRSKAPAVAWGVVVDGALVHQARSGCARSARTLPSTAAACSGSPR